VIGNCKFPQTELALWGPSLNYWIGSCRLDFGSMPVVSHCVPSVASLSPRFRLHAGCVPSVASLSLRFRLHGGWSRCVPLLLLHTLNSLASLRAAVRVPHIASKREGVIRLPFTWLRCSLPVARRSSLVARRPLPVARYPWLVARASRWNPAPVSVAQVLVTRCPSLVARPVTGARRWLPAARCPHECV